MVRDADALLVECNIQYLYFLLNFPEYKIVCYDYSHSNLGKLQFCNKNE